MKLAVPGEPHLTYCTNIHPGETWDAVRLNLERHVRRVKAAVAPDRPFGVGLRLSAVAAATLAQPAELEEFRAFLRESGFYVFTINGFPYGPFHGTRVKEEVYLPDWLDDARLSTATGWRAARRAPARRARARGDGQHRARRLQGSRARRGGRDRMAEL